LIIGTGYLTGSRSNAPGNELSNIRTRKGQIGPI